MVLCRQTVMHETERTLQGSTHSSNSVASRHAIDSKCQDAQSTTPFSCVLQTVLHSLLSKSFPPDPETRAQQHVNHTHTCRPTNLSLPPQHVRPCQRSHVREHLLSLIETTVLPTPQPVRQHLQQPHPLRSSLKGGEGGHVTTAL